MYERIKKLLIERGKDMAWLSRESGVSQSVLSSMRTRGNNLNAKNLYRVSKVLKKRMEYFVEE